MLNDTTGIQSEKFECGVFYKTNKWEEKNFNQISSKKDLKCI